MRTALVLMVVGAGLIGSVYSRFITLLLYVWFSLFRAQDWAWVYPLVLFRLSLVIGMVLVVPCILTGVWPNFTHPLSIFMSMFFVTALIAHLGASNAEMSLLWVDSIGRIIIISLLIVPIVRDRNKFLILLAVAAGSLGVHGAKYGVSFILSGGTAHFTEGIGGQFGDNNDFALAVVRILFLLIAVAQNAPAWWIRLGFLAAVPLGVLGVVGTYSRGAFLGLAAGTIAFTALQRRKVFAASVLLVLVTLTLQFAPIPDEYYVRLQTIRSAQESPDESAAGRLHFWTVAMEMANARPFGVGLRNYEYAYNYYDPAAGALGSNRAVHSSHFQVLAELGYPGAFAWIGLLLFGFVAPWRARARAKRPDVPPDVRHFLWTTSNAFIASMVAFLVGGSFLSQALNDLNWVFFGLAASLDYLSYELCTAKQAAPVPVAAPVRSPIAIGGRLR